jgi:hypothetical protein
MHHPSAINSIIGGWWDNSTSLRNQLNPTSPMQHIKWHDSMTTPRWLDHGKVIKYIVKYLRDTSTKASSCALFLSAPLMFLPMPILSETGTE